MTIPELLEKCVERYGEPKDLYGSLLRIACSYTLVPAGAQLSLDWIDGEPPGELVQFWSQYQGASLFEDVEYGQWGLVLLSAEESCGRTVLEFDRRSADFNPQDIVVGEFRGDQDLLVYTPGEDGRGSLLVALPLDPRSEWYSVGDSLEKFLARFIESEGNKFWEVGIDD